MYIVKTKYSLETNIDPLKLLKKAKELKIHNLIIADDGPYAWLELEKWNHQYQINILYAIEKERNGVKMIWIPKGDILKNIAKLETAYRTNHFGIIKNDDFTVLLVPNTVTKKEALQKDLDTIKWLKANISKCYILEKKEAYHNIRILKEKSGIHTLSLKQINYLDPTERDISLMRKAIKVGKLIDDDYRSFLLPTQYLEQELGQFELKRTNRVLEEIKQEFIIEGHPKFRAKKMEFWNTKEIEQTKIPTDWTRFFGKQISLPQSNWEKKKLALLCYKAGYGFNKRYSKLETNTRKEILNRLKYELSVIALMGFDTYFLIVEDFIRFCKKNNIRVGKGRGSVVGCLLAFCLGIIQIDPITHDLKFERFLNPQRKGFPDIDTDFPSSQIDMVFDYVKEKYGVNNVSKILTFNTFGVINAIQGIKNVFKIKERIETWFPEGLENLDEFLVTDEGKLVKEKLNKKGYGHVLNYVNGISDLPQAISVHPAGVIISQELNELPLIERDGELVLAFTKHDDQMERLGVIKFDFLKVKTLDVIKQTEEIRRELGKPVYPLDLNDNKTFELYRSGNTVGVFQVSSVGMRKTCQGAKPSSIADLMDIISLYRPGPMEEIPRYIDNKEKGSWHFENLSPNSPEFQDIVPILDKTHGIIIYQEQILEMASTWAGYSLGEADLLRRAISEKNQNLMEEEKKKFIDRSLQNGREKSITEYIYYLIEKFAKYGYNRSHATGYTFFSFETAFQKTHYPVEFMVASLNVNIDKRKKIKTLLSEVKRMNIDVLRPDLYESDVNFTVTKDGRIRMGLAAISGIGIKEATKIKQLVSGHKKKTFEEVKNQLYNYGMKGTKMDKLIRAGVFDSYGDRYKIWQSVKDKKNQKPLNGKSPFLLYIEWEQDLLQYTFSLKEIQEGVPVGEYIIESISKIKDKKSREMAFLKVIGKYNRKELVVYYNIWALIKDKIDIGTIIIPTIKDEKVATSIKVKE